MDRLLLELLQRLESVGDEDESLYDTVVREAMGDPVFFMFVSPTPGQTRSDDFGMSPEQNKVIRVALGQYIQAASALAPQLGLVTFHQRLEAFQDNAVQTAAGNFYDDFFGWSDPKAFDEGGNVIRRV